MDALIYDWNEHLGAAPALRPVQVDDETLRDGLQSPSVRSPTIEQKRRCLRLMCALGVQRVDVGLPMSSQQGDIRALLATLRDESLPIQPGLAVRTVQGDLETVARLRDEFPELDLKANAFLGSSRLRRWVEGWSWETVLDRTARSIEWATARGVPVMFVTEDTTRSHPEDLARLYQRAVQAGAGEICVADTVGHIMPWGARALVRYVRQALMAVGRGEVLINWHGHQDRGAGLLNNLAAMEGGADVIHGTILGIGERAGNAPLDQLLVNLQLMGLWDRPLSPLRDYVALVAEATGVEVPVSYPMFGRDAFRTATGVHAAAIMKARAADDPTLVDRVYSGVPAQQVGRRQTIELGPLSGKWCAIAWLEDHQMSADPALVAALVTYAQAADRVLTEDEVQTFVDAR